MLLYSGSVYKLYKENAAGVGLFKGGMWTRRAELPTPATAICSAEIVPQFAEGDFGDTAGGSEKTRPKTESAVSLKLGCCRKFQTPV